MNKIKVKNNMINYICFNFFNFSILLIAIGLELTLILIYFDISL